MKKTIAIVWTVVGLAGAGYISQAEEAKGPVAPDAAAPKAEMPVTAPAVTPAIAPADPVMCKEKTKKPVPVLEEITVTGKLTKEEKVKTDKKGREIKQEIYKVTQADGAVVAIPKAKAKKGQEPAYNLDTMLDKNVKIVGMGRTKTSTKKDGTKKTHIMIQSVKSMEEVAAQ